MGSSASILNDKLVYQSEKLFYNTFSKNSNGRIIINPKYKTHNDDNVMKDYPESRWVEPIYGFC